MHGTAPVVPPSARGTLPLRQGVRADDGDDDESHRDPVARLVGRGAPESGWVVRGGVE